MPLTDTLLKALKPRENPYIIMDERGLYIEVFPTGGLVWQYRYRLNDKQEKVTLGKYPGLSLKAARVKRDELVALVVKGESPAKRKQLTKLALDPSTTVQVFGERYFQEIVTRDRQDASPIRRYFDKEIYPAIGTKSLREVTAADVQALVYRKRDHGFEAAAAQIRNLIKRLFDYALVLGAAEKNPAHALPSRFIAKARTRTRTLSPDEIRIYLQTLYASNIRHQFKMEARLSVKAVPSLPGQSGVLFLFNYVLYCSATS